jgi:hypothetical protein
MKLSEFIKLIKDSNLTEFFEISENINTHQFQKILRFLLMPPMKLKKY